MRTPTIDNEQISVCYTDSTSTGYVHRIYRQIVHWNHLNSLMNLHAISTMGMHYFTVVQRGPLAPYQQPLLHLDSLKVPFPTHLSWYVIVILVAFPLWSVFQTIIFMSPKVTKHLWNKENTNKYKKSYCSWINVKTPVLPKAISAFSVMFIKLPRPFFPKR